MHDSDEQLVKRTLDGNHSKYDCLVQKYQAAVYGITYQWTRNFADAQDLTQEAFLQAYRKLDQLKDPARFAGWLRGIATNICHMWNRKQERNRASFDLLAHDDIINQQDPAPQQQEILEAKEQRRAIVDVLDLLSDTARLAARLFYVDGLTYQEMSDVLGVPITTVESRLHRARNQLKKEIFGQQTDARRKKVVERLNIIAKEAFQMDAVRLEICGDLIPLVEAPGTLLSEIGQMRSDLTAEHDLSVPPVRIRDNIYLASRSYMIFIHEERVAEGQLDADGDAAVLTERLKDSLLENREKLSG